MNLITLFYVCVQYHQSAFHSVSVFTSSFFLSACFYPFGVTFLFACFVWYECLFFCFGFFGMCIWFLVFFYFFFTFWSLVIWIFCIYFLLSPLFSPHLFHVSSVCLVHFPYIFPIFLLLKGHLRLHCHGTVSLAYLGMRQYFPCALRSVVQILCLLPT